MILQEVILQNLTSFLLRLAENDGPNCRKTFSKYPKGKGKLEQNFQAKYQIRNNFSRMLQSQSLTCKFKSSRSNLVY